jgi:hypothetical protein
MMAAKQPKFVDPIEIRNGLQSLIQRGPAGGLWTNAETGPDLRNSFCLQLDPDGPIYTVTISVGGALRRY